MKVTSSKLRRLQGGTSDLPLIPTPSALSPHDFVRRNEAASRLGVTARTLGTWQRKGLVPYLKLGRTILFDWPDVAAHLRKNFRLSPPAPTQDALGRSTGPIRFS